MFQPSRAIARVQVFTSMYQHHQDLGGKPNQSLLRNSKNYFRNTTQPVGRMNDMETTLTSLNTMSLDDWVSERGRIQEHHNEGTSPRSHTDYDIMSNCSNGNKDNVGCRNDATLFQKQASVRGPLKHAPSERSLCSTRGWNTLDSVHSSSRELEWIESAAAEDAKESSFSDSFCSFESLGDSPSPLESAASTLFTMLPEDQVGDALAPKLKKQMSVRRGPSFRREMSLSQIREVSHD